MEIRRRSKNKILIIAVSFSVIVLIIYILVSNMVLPGLIQYSTTRIQAICTDGIYGAVLKWMTENPEEYVTLYQTEDQVYYVEMNNMALNRLAANCSNDIQNYINSVGKQGITIPWGTASGIPLLAGMGPNIKLTFYPEGTTQVDFDSEFRSAGINQTLHRVHIVVCADVAMVLPGATRNVPTRVVMTVSEHIIVGKVPDAYVSGSGGGILNLTPGN